MAVSGVTAQNIFIGAGDLFYKDSAGLWQPAGATVGDNSFMVTRKYVTADLNGVIGPIIGTDYITDELVELDCSLAEISAAVMNLMVADSLSTGGAAPAASGTASGTLSAATTAGQFLAVKVSSVTGMVVGTFIKFGAAPNVEYRKLTRVGTALVGGTGIDLDFPLINPHVLAEAFASVDSDGTSLITSSANRRLPTTAYHDWYLEVPGVDGRNARFMIDKALVIDPAGFTASDSKEMAIKVKIQGRRDGATPNVPCWRIQKVPTYLV